MKKIKKKKKKEEEEKEICVEIDYIDNKGNKNHDTKLIKFPKIDKDEEFFGGIAARKAILLTRYVNLMKNYIRDERNYRFALRIESSSSFSSSTDYEKGISIPPLLSPDNKQIEEKIWLSSLNKPYDTIFEKFQEYYMKEAEKCDDEQLETEMKLIEKLIDIHKRNIKNDNKESKQIVALPFDWEKRNKMIEEKMIKEKQKNNNNNSNDNNKIIESKDSVDICFIMDCTGSMGAWIALCKNKINNVVDVVTSHFKNVPINIGFVGYRDHCDSQRFEILPLTDNVDNVKNFVAAIQASGGGDAPEDLPGGMNKALESIKWKSEKKLCIIICDAPCHGKMFHELGDSYPEGDPTGLEPEILLNEMVNRKIHLLFADVDNCTNKMFAIWKKCYDKNDKGLVLKQFKLQHDADFLPNIADAIAGLIAT